MRCVPEPPNLTLLCRAGASRALVAARVLAWGAALACDARGVGTWQETQTPQSSRVQPWHSPQRCLRSFALAAESRGEESATTRCGEGSDTASGRVDTTSAAITKLALGLWSSAIPVAACAEAKALSSSSVVA